MAFLGGLGTISGPLLGALIMIPVQQFFTIYFSETDSTDLLWGHVPARHPAAAGGYRAATVALAPCLGA